MKNENSKNLYKYVIYIIIIIIAIYLIAMIYGLIREPTNIFVVENGKLTLEEEAIGYIIREETVLKGENYKNGMVKICSEGQKVKVGASIFRYYNKDEENLVQKIQELDEKIDETMGNEINVFSSDIKVLDNKIQKDIELLYHENDLGKIAEIKKSIEESVTKKATIAGEQSPAGSYVKKLINERAEYEYKLNSGTEDVKTDVAGIVSYKIDGLENVLTPSEFKNITPKSLEELNLKVGRTIQENEESGKVINNFKFYIAIVLDDEKTSELTIGKSAKIRLSSQEELSCKIAYIGEPQDNSKVVIFETNGFSQELINYRKISIDIIWWSDGGLKIPNSALITENELTYVIRNRAGYLDKVLVKVLRKNDNYCIVGKYKTDELKNLGYSQSEIINMKSIALYDEILLNGSDYNITELLQKN